MSKRKRNVAFLKPEEPAFITRMKAQAGYKEGPTVDTKREALSFDEDSDDQDDEQPQVVVVKEGDLTAEEASKAKLDKEEGPADLAQRVVFKKPEKASKNVVESSEASDTDSLESKKSKIESEKDPVKESNTRSKKESKKDSAKRAEPKPKAKGKSLLSFNADEDEDS